MAADKRPIAAESVTSIRSSVDIPRRRSSFDPTKPETKKSEYGAHAVHPYLLTENIKSRKHITPTELPHNIVH